MLPIKKLVILENKRICYVKVGILLLHVQGEVKNIKGIVKNNDIGAAQAEQTRGTHTREGLRYLGCL